MDELVSTLFVACWLVCATVGTIDNFLGQTPDNRIIKMCKEKGYLNVKQERVTCSVDHKKD